MTNNMSTWMQPHTLMYNIYDIVVTLGLEETRDAHWQHALFSLGVPALGSDLDSGSFYVGCCFAQGCMQQWG